MASALENLTTQYEQALSRLVELDAVPIDERWRGTYSFNGKMIDWNAYRAALQRTVDSFAKQVEANLKAAQMIAGPFTILGQAGCSNDGSP